MKDALESVGVTGILFLPLLGSRYVLSLQRAALKRNGGLALIRWNLGFEGCRRLAKSIVSVAPASVGNSIGPADKSHRRTSPPTGQSEPNLMIGRRSNGGMAGLYEL
jgi:hypothetical protein